MERVTATRTRFGRFGAFAVLVAVFVAACDSVLVELSELLGHTVRWSSSEEQADQMIPSLPASVRIALVCPDRAAEGWHLIRLLRERSSKTRIAYLSSDGSGAAADFFAVRNGDLGTQREIAKAISWLIPRDYTPLR